MEYRKPMQPMPLTRCQNLTCKGMQVFGDEYMTPVDDAHRSTDFWCVKTQNVLGPDGALVVLTSCTPSRECYEAL